MSRRKRFLLSVACVALLALASGRSHAQGSACPQDVLTALGRIHVTPTEGGANRREMVCMWLRDRYSGYPDLYQVLVASITCPEGGCRVRGPLLPLDVIEGKCRQLRGKPDQVITDHKPDEVRRAYKMAWDERNPTGEDKTLEQILSGE